MSLTSFAYPNWKGCKLAAIDAHFMPVQDIQKMRELHQASAPAEEKVRQVYESGNLALPQIFTCRMLASFMALSAALSAVSRPRMAAMPLNCCAILEYSFRSMRSHTLGPDIKPYGSQVVLRTVSTPGNMNDCSRHAFLKWRGVRSSHYSFQIPKTIGPATSTDLRSLQMPLTCDLV